MARDTFYVNLFLIAIGGAVGSVARSLLSTSVLRVTGLLFPIGTFVVNVVGCLLFGAIVGAAQVRFVLSPEARAFLLVGILGGFTTFSSYTFESVGLMQDGRFLAATLNIVGQVIVSLVAYWVGFAIGGLW